MLVKVNTSVFEGLKDTSHSFAQILRLDRSLFNLFADNTGSVTISRSDVSSANRFASVARLSVMSLTWTKKRRGPSIDPWGTPASMGRRGDDAPLMTTRCRLQVK